MKNYFVSTCVVALLLPCTAFAQDAAAALETDGLGEIVVTAQRREQSIQKTALAITAVSGEEIERRAQVSLPDVLSTTPSVQVQATSGGGQIYIRGVGSNSDSVYGNPAVNLNIDGIYQQQASTVISGLYDVERIEVLRGPQGTLYGRNATGGSINIITRDPEFDDIEVAGSVLYGNYDHIRLQGSVNLPVTGDWALRGAVSFNNRAGYASSGGSDSEYVSMRLKSLFQASPDVRILLAARYTNEGGAPTASYPAPLSETDPYVTNYLEGIHDGETFGLDGQIDWTTGIGVLTAQYGRIDSSRWDNRQLLGAVTSFDYDELQNTAELRLASLSSSPVTWVAGLYYLHSDQQRGTRPNQIGGTYMGAQNVSATTETVAGFGQLTVPLSARFRATVGGRYTKETKRQTYAANPEFRYEDDAFTGKAGLEFDIADRSMLYGGIATGYKAGGFAENPASLAYAAETVTSYNIGVKNRFLGNRLQVNAEAFYYDYTNYQASFPLLIDGVFFILTRNAGQATVKGFEIETEASLWRNGTLRVAVSHLDARFGNFAYTDISGPRDFSNLSMPNAPLWSGDISYEHRFDLANGADVTVSIASHISEGYWTTVERTLDSYQPSFTRTDLNLAYNAADGRWSIAGYVRNLENEPVRLLGLANPSSSRLILGAPRTYGVVGSFKF